MGRLKCHLLVHNSGWARQDGGIASARCDAHHTMSHCLRGGTSIRTYGRPHLTPAKHPSEALLSTPSAARPRPFRSGLFALSRPVVPHDLVERVERSQPAGRPVRTVPPAAAAAVPLRLLRLPLCHRDLPPHFMRLADLASPYEGPTSFVDSPGEARVLV